MRFSIAAILGCGLVSACASPSATQATDAQAALNIASVGVSVYAADPHANPQRVAELKALLSGAQAAVQSWAASGSSGDQAAASAALAALVSYQAQLQTQAAAPPSQH